MPIAGWLPSSQFDIQSTELRKLVKIPPEIAVFGFVLLLALT